MNEGTDEVRWANEHKDYLATKNFSALNGLRAISVIAVVWHHTAGVTYPASNLLSRGYLGVDFFFAISGFLITTLLLREQQLFDTISLRKFYLRRTLRIFPLYYSVLIGYTALTLATRYNKPEGKAFLDHLPAFITYTTNWFVDLSAGSSVTFYLAWSLATEEQFYLLWPPILACLSKHTRSSNMWLIATLIGAGGIALIARHMGADPFVWKILGSLSLPILFGSLGAIILNDDRGYRMLAPVLGATLAAPMLMIALVPLLAAHPGDELIQFTMALIVLSCCIRENRFVSPLLTFRPLAWIGTISYGVYLMHMLASNALRPILGEHGAANFLGTVVLVMVMATLSYRLFEQPILTNKDRFRATRIPQSSSAESGVEPSLPTQRRATPSEQATIWGVRHTAARVPRRPRLGAGAGVPLRALQLPRHRQRRHRHRRQPLQEWRRTSSW